MSALAADADALALDADAGTRQLLSSLIVAGMNDGASPGAAVTGVTSGALAAISQIWWTFRDDGATPEVIADGLRNAALSYLHQCATADAGGGQA